MTVKTKELTIALLLAVFTTIVSEAFSRIAGVCSVGSYVAVNGVRL